MKTMTGRGWLTLVGVAFCFASPIKAQVPDPGEWAPDWLDYWSFSYTNHQTYFGFTPVSSENLGSSYLGNGPAVGVDSANPAWLHYNVLEADGTNLLKLDQGSLVFWFAPSWSSANAGGTGPGDWGRFLEVGSYTTNASFGWWSIYTDPGGTNIYFAAQTNGAEAVYLSAPISWTTNVWHMIALTYSSTNSTLYLDGEFVTNGLPVAYWPGANVISNGFWIGSDSNGLAQAHGLFDDLFTFGSVLEDKSISETFDLYYIYYYLNPLNEMNMASAHSEPEPLGPVFNAVTGTGFLTAVGTNTLNCVSSASLWLTNIVAERSGANMMVTFEIAGGTGGVHYDVFANSVLPASNDVSSAWAWVGQGNQCVSYSITNLPSTTCFLILGTPLDSDSDGLTDAYETLVSRTDPQNPDTDGDRMLDGWEVMWGINALANDSAQSSERSNYTYDSVGWLNVLSGTRAETITLDAEANVLEVSP